MLQYTVDETGKITLVLLHDCDGTDIVAVEDVYCVLDEVNGEVVKEQ